MSLHVSFMKMKYLWTYHCEIFMAKVLEEKDDREIFGEDFRRSSITLNGINGSRFNRNLGY